MDQVEAEVLAGWLKKHGFPRGTIDTGYMTGKEQALFSQACDRFDVAHSRPAPKRSDDDILSMWRP